MIPQKTDVVIVGAGPTGLALALGLQQAGADYLLIDKLPQPLNTSRAGVIHAHTLEMLDQLGVTNELVGRGLKVTDFAIRDRGRQLVRLPFQPLPTPHPYMLMLPQDVTESVLTERLSALGGTILRGVEASSAGQDSGGAYVTVTAGDRVSRVKARYVVAADGMHSVVRAAAGMDFDGAPYPESFVLADVRMDWIFGAAEVSLLLSPDGMIVVAPLPNGIHRIVAMLNNPPVQPSAADLQALLEARGPAAEPARIHDVLWSSRFRVHHRLAKSYRRGRFFLIGDAAHVHSPAGGQGMNTGLVDAVVLGQLLAGVLGGSRPESDLDQYERLRRPAAAKVLKLAGVLTTLATVRGGTRRAVRNAVLRALNLLPPARNRLVMNLSGLSRNEFAAISSSPPARLCETSLQGNAEY